MHRKKIFEKKGIIGLLGIALLGFALLRLTLGPVEISLHQISAIFLNQLGVEVAPDAFTSIHESVLLSIRVPRTLLGIFVGAALAMAGAVMQGLFKNPLADPTLIGISSGAAVGAIVFIVLGGEILQGLGPGFRIFGLASFAMIGGVGATILIFQLSKVEGRTQVTTMLLVGIALNAFAVAFIGLILYQATDMQMREFVFWSLGSLGGASGTALAYVAPIIGLSIGALLGYARSLNILLLGEAEAYHMGMNVQKVKKHLIFLSAGMVGAAVSLTGMIGFVGLVVPHLIRLCLGPDHRSLLPASVLLGAILLLLADLVATTVAAPAELPIGIITALIGAPFFLGLLLHSKRQLLS